MKNLNLLVFMTQLGLSVAIPPLGFILLACWLRNRWSWGDWVIWVGIILGIVCAVDGFRTALKSMDRISRHKEQQPPPISFNDHD